VNLRDERLDMQLRTEAKHFSIGSLPAPIHRRHVEESLHHAGREFALRGGAAVSLGFIFRSCRSANYQFGTGEEHRCDPGALSSKQAVSACCARGLPIRGSKLSE
jgi:hypothetical protein